MKGQIFIQFVILDP